MMLESFYVFTAFHWIAHITCRKFTHRLDLKHLTLLLKRRQKSSYGKV